MKSFALFCFLLLASACVFARAEEETAVEEPKIEEDQPEVAADEADEPEEESDEETETDEEDEESDEEKRTYCKPICSLICKKKACSRRICKRVGCGSSKACRSITKYRLVKYKVKLPYSYDYYGPQYAIKVKKVPYSISKCYLIPKYCTKCNIVSYICGKTCQKVCKKTKCYTPYY